MQRAALYIRVSTEEQAQHGYSLEAQRETLTKYAKTHDMAIVDYYIDDGYSARKAYTNRKGFMRMLNDVESDKIDIILFIKLDRWFRSVKDYYKIQEILEAHNVGWKTTEENYDTTTTNGRLYINIRLSVAQDESDRTSDRIKYVFDSKVTRGEVISGAQPPGLKIVDKKLVHDDEKKDMVQDMFRHFKVNQSKYATLRYMLDTYGLYIEKSTLKRHLTNTLYVGEYRGNPNYCEPLIDRETFETVQRIIKSRCIRKPRTDRVYIFPGLLRCSTCDHTMSSRYVEHGGKSYYHYRCNYAMDTKQCPNRMTLNESYVENWLLENIEDLFRKSKSEYAIRMESKPKPAVDRAKIKRKIEKLKELYLNELITLEEYKADYDMYKAQVEVEAEPDEPSVNFDRISELITSETRIVYPTLDRKERQVFWRGIIKRIYVNLDKTMNVFFI